MHILETSYCSDKYQYTMGKTFHDLGLENKRAVFNLFYRSAPDKNNWAVVSGIEQAIEMVKALEGQDEPFFEKLKVIITIPEVYQSRPIYHHQIQIFYHNI